MSGLLLKNLAANGEDDEEYSLQLNENEENDMELDHLVVALRNTNFDPNLPLIQVEPDLLEVERLAHMTAYLADDPEHQPRIEVGLELTLSVNGMVSLIKNEVDRIMEENPKANVRIGIEDYLNRNFATPPAKFDRVKLSKVLRNIMKAFKLSYRAFKSLDSKIHEGISYLHAQHAHFIQNVMPTLTDEQLDQFETIHKLMGKQLEALQRLRSAKISGLREVIITMNQTLHVYSHVELAAALT